MKYKLTDISFDKLEYSPKELNTGTLINLKYDNEILEFQTPKILIHEIIKEGGKEYFLLKIIGNEACKKFIQKILELEQSFNKHFGVTVKSIFEGDHFIVKIPFIFSKPNMNVYSSDNSLFNYYHLSKGMEIICLLQCNKLWMNKDSSFYYHLQVKEIMLLKK